MNFPKQGDLVKSLAGHDKNQFFIVISVKDGFLYLADGDLRRVEKPKKKNLRHCVLVKENPVIRTSKDIGVANAEIRKCIKEFLNKEDLQIG